MPVKPNNARPKPKPAQGHGSGCCSKTAELSERLDLALEHQERVEQEIVKRIQALEAKAKELGDLAALQGREP